jgi:hypothetical protein
MYVSYNHRFRRLPAVELQFCLPFRATTHPNTVEIGFFEREINFHHL